MQYNNIAMYSVISQYWFEAQKNSAPFKEALFFYYIVKKLNEQYQQYNDEQQCTT